VAAEQFNLLSSSGEWLLSPDRDPCIPAAARNPAPGGRERRAAIGELSFKTASRETGFSMQPLSRELRAAPSVSGEEDADATQVVDVSSHVSADGILQWIFPSGTWEVLRIGYTDSAKSLTDYKGARLGLEMDAMSSHAFDNYWQQAVVPLLDAAKPYIAAASAIS